MVADGPTIYTSGMESKNKTTKMPATHRWYRGADVPMRVIRRFADQVAERFQPEKIILFGSHAYGKPHADSDVDILVVMPARNELDQAIRIRLSVDYQFPLDLLVRTPRNLAWRLAEGDAFLREVVAKGKVLYEKDEPRVGTKGRDGSTRSSKARIHSASDA
jgi:predicted nucleotidyltransferase